MTAYRILLLLYPASFRAQYGDELCRIFSVRVRNASPAERLLVWFDAIFDLILSAVQTHWDIFRQDVRYVRRTLGRSPGFALTAVGVVALGIGATTTAYTIADHVLIRPLPFPDSDRLVKLWEDMSPSGYTQMEPSPANYMDRKRMSKSFSGMAASRGTSYSLVGVGRPEQVDGAAVTSDLFPMLGARAALGRLFAPKDDRPGAPGTAVISYGFWQSRFGGDGSIVGRRILLDGAPYVVIGVMQKDFDYPERNLQVWTTMRFVNGDFEDRNDNYLRVVAKLRPGVSIDQARAEMILRESLALAFSGALIGSALGYAAGRSLQGLLAGVRPADGLTYAAALAVIAVMTMGGKFLAGIAGAAGGPDGCCPLRIISRLSFLL